MGRWSERRALSAEDSELDTSMELDINEYLISNWTTLTLKQRQAVWHSCQSDEEFDWSTVEDQIDDWVEALAEGNPDWVLPEEDDSPEEELTDEELEEELDDMIEDLKTSIGDYVSTFWDVEDEKEIETIAENLLELINDAVDNEFEDEDEPLEDNEEPSVEQTEDKQ